MPSPSLLLLPLHHLPPPLSPRFPSSSLYPFLSLRVLPPAPLVASGPRLAPAAAARRTVTAVARPYRSCGATRKVSRGSRSPALRGGSRRSPRREQAVAAAAVADGGAAAESHLAAGANSMVMEAFLPGVGGGAASTRVILQAKEVKEKASKITSDFGADFFSENEPESESILAMALKQVVVEQLSVFQLQVFFPGSERDFQDWSKPRKVPVDFSIGSSDGKLLSALAEAIFSCAIEDMEKNYLGGTGGLFQMRKLNCSSDSTVCIQRISEAEVVNDAMRCLESFNLVNSSHEVGKADNAWWPAPKHERLGKIGGPDFILWAHEFIPTYKLQIGAEAFVNTKLEGCHELSNNRWEVLLSHLQLVELGNVLDMYFEDQFTLPGKTFHSCWNAEPSKIRKKKVQGYLNNLFVFLAGSCIILTVGIIAQLCWPQSLKEKRLFLGSSRVSSSQSYRSDVHSLDNNEARDYCMSVVKKIKDSCGYHGDILVDENIGAWVGELPDCFKGINLADNAASDDVLGSSAVSQENKTTLVSTPTKTTSHLEQNDNTQETLQNIASFQVVISEEGKIVGFQPTNRLAVNHWATNPLTAQLYGARKLSPAFMEPRLKISRPVKVVPIELLMTINSESFFALARPVQDPC